MKSIGDQQYRVKTLKELVHEFGDNASLNFQYLVVRSSGGNLSIKQIKLGRPYSNLLGKSEHWKQTFLKETK
jgi:hypothetical protein